MQAPLPPVVAVLGYTGLIPFFLPVVAALLDWPPLPLGLSWSFVQVAYGAVILSFLGALHWGVAMSSERLGPAARSTAYLWSVIPALVAWLALLLAGLLGALLLIVALLSQWLMDRRLHDLAGLPGWFLPLRTQLTAGATMSLLAMLLITR